MLFTLNQKGGGVINGVIVEAEEAPLTAPAEKLQISELCSLFHLRNVYGFDLYQVVRMRQHNGLLPSHTVRVQHLRCSEARRTAGDGSLIH